MTEILIIKRPKHKYTASLILKDNQGNIIGSIPIGKYYTIRDSEDAIANYLRFKQPKKGE